LTADLLDVAKYKPLKTTANAIQLDKLKLSEKITQAPMAVKIGSNSSDRVTNADDKFLRL